MSADNAECFKSATASSCEHQGNIHMDQQSVGPITNVCNSASAVVFIGQGLCSYYSEERKLPQWFGLSSYITLEPNSYSKRILNPQVLLISPGSATTPG